MEKNFSVGISFKTSTIPLQSYFNFWPNQYTLNEWVYLGYLSGIDPHNFLGSFSKGEFTILEVIKKECHRLWKQFSKRHTKMFALIKLHWKKCLTSWDEYLEGNRTHLIYSGMFDKKSIPLLIFTLYFWKELKCFWLCKERGIRIVCSLPLPFQRFLNWLRRGAISSFLIMFAFL